MCVCVSVFLCLCGWEVLQHSKMGVKDRRRADEERNKTKETWAKGEGWGGG